MPADLENSPSVSGEPTVSSLGNTDPPPKSTVKKKRNLPGMPGTILLLCVFFLFFCFWTWGVLTVQLELWFWPDPDAEVIALSPKTLLATNRFVCEICNKGFQRDQNLQLHRRGHNLPWKLRQRSSNEVKKKVYVCPETSCVHHDPSRALGDLTGIKKHFCRKHGEKKWKCDKCSKKYAVQSDWKAHSKICGTREYKCDCGTLFSRFVIPLLFFTFTLFFMFCFLIWVFFVLPLFVEGIASLPIELSVMHWQRKVQKLSLSRWWTNRFLILLRKRWSRWSQIQSYLRRRHLRRLHLLLNQLVFYLLPFCRFKVKVRSTTALLPQLALSCIVLCPNEMNRTKFVCSLFVSQYVETLDCSVVFCLLLFLCFHLGKFSEQLDLMI